MNAKIRTVADAKDAAKRVIEEQTNQQNAKRMSLEQILNNFKSINPDLGGFEEIAVLLNLPDKEFSVLGKVFLEELEKSFNNVNDQALMVQQMNLAGIRAEDVKEEYIKFCDALDNDLSDALSAPKRDFLKRMIALTYNGVTEAQGIGKRNILIPIEYCHPDAKMPLYAHATDAGADIYITEDVTIHPGETKLLSTGIKVAVPRGYALMVYPKSGRSLKTKLRISNSVGVIDSGFRGEIGIIVDNIDPVIRSAEMDEDGRLHNIDWGSDITLSKGEKVAQLILTEVPKAVFYEVKDIDEVEGDGRGQKGFGSSGDR